MNIAEGDIVEACQELAVIDTIQYDIQLRILASNRSTATATKADSRIQTDALQVQLQQLRTEQQRISNLLIKGAATRQQKEEVDSKIAAIESQIKAIRETISNTNSVTDGNAASIDLQAEGVRDMLRRCHIQSPLHGTVIAKYAEQGEVTVAGHPLLKLADLDNVYLRAYFPGSKMAQIKLGQKVTVSTLYGGNERQYEGTITWISSESEFTPKSIPTTDERSNLKYAVKIAIRNDEYIRLGLNGEVWL